jgi:hypothetical protein
MLASLDRIDVIPRIEGLRRFFPFSFGPTGLTNGKIDRKKWRHCSESVYQVQDTTGTVGGAPREERVAKQPTRERNREVN